MRYILGLIMASLSAPAMAFDCAQAKTGVEHAICSHQTLKAKDEALNKQYQAMLAVSENKQQIRLSQRKWLAERDASCGGDSVESTRVDCLEEITDRRLRYFSPLRIQGADAVLELLPYIGFQKANTKEARTNVDIELFKFNRPTTKGPQQFNARMATIIREATWFAEPAEEADRYFISMQADINDFSPAFISVTIIDGSGYPHTAGAQGGVSTVNVNLKEGRDAEYDDVFNAAALDLIKSSCDKQIRDNKAEMGIEPDRASYLPDIERKAYDMDAWVLTRQSATLLFAAYELGAGAEGSYECSFSGAIYRSMVSKDVFE